MKSIDFNILKNPPADAVSALLSQCGPDALRGIEDHHGNIYLWPYEQATHMIAAAMLGIPYDRASDFANDLAGKTFYIRSLDDWRKRERRRAGSDSFTSKVRSGR